MVITVSFNLYKSNSMRCPDEEDTVSATMGSNNVEFNFESGSTAFNLEKKLKYTIGKAVYKAETTEIHQNVQTKYIWWPLVMKEI